MVKLINLKSAKMYKRIFKYLANKIDYFPGKKYKRKLFYKYKYPKYQKIMRGWFQRATPHVEKRTEMFSQMKCTDLREHVNQKILK